MSFLLIVLVLLVQHYFFATRPCLPLAGYKGIFFSAGSVVSKLPQLWRFLLWLFPPLLLLGVIDWYLWNHLSFTVSMLLNGAVMLFVIGYADVRWAMASVNKEGITPAQCLLLYTKVRDVQSNQGNLFYLVTLMSLRCIFCALLFSYLFVGYGALLVLLVYGFAVNDMKTRAMERVVLVLEWIPVRLLYLTLVLDNNPAAIGHVLASFFSAQSAESLVRNNIMQDVFEYGSHSKTRRIHRLWLRQLAIWLVSMALIYIVTLLFF